MSDWSHKSHTHERRSISIDSGILHRRGLLLRQLTWVNAGFRHLGDYLPMSREARELTGWALAGAIVASIGSVLTLLLPPGLGGYNAWNDANLVVHNLAAILTRIVVFALAGAALAGAWHHNGSLRH